MTSNKDKNSINDNLFAGVSSLFCSAVLGPMCCKPQIAKKSVWGRLAVCQISKSVSIGPSGLAPALAPQGVRLFEVLMHKAQVLPLTVVLVQCTLAR